jgi:hypothetical protein
MKLFARKSPSPMTMTRCSRRLSVAVARLGRFAPGELVRGARERHGQIERAADVAALVELDRSVERTGLGPARGAGVHQHRALPALGGAETDAGGLREHRVIPEAAHHRVRAVFGDHDRRGVAGDVFGRRVHDHTRMEFNAETFRQRFQPEQQARVVQPQQAAPAIDIVLDFPDFAREQSRARSGDHQHRGVVRNPRVFAKRQRAGLEAAALQLPGPGGQIEVRLLVRAAFAVTAEEYHPALAAMTETRERVGEILFVELCRREAFARVAVFEHQFAVELHAGLAHALGRGVRIDELQRDVGFVLLVARHHFPDEPAGLAALTGEGGDLERFLEPFRHRPRSPAPANAGASGPVELQVVFLRQPLQQPHGQQEQHHEAEVHQPQLPAGFWRVIHTSCPILKTQREGAKAQRTRRFVCSIIHQFSLRPLRLCVKKLI